MARYFITGGTGFIGRALVRELLKFEDTEHITCLTRGTRKDLLTHERLSYLVGNVTDVKFPDETFTDVIHAAADSGDLSQSDPYKYYYEIVEGARRVFSWANGYRSLFISSGVTAGQSVYFLGKYTSELLGGFLNHAKIARLYTVCGEEMPIASQYALGKFIGQAIDAGKVQYYSSGSIRSYLYIEDVARYLIAVLEGGIASYPYDVGSERPIVIDDLAHLVARICGVPIERIEGKSERPWSIYLPNLTNIRKLGVTETVGLEDAIRRIYAHVRHTRLQAA